MTEHKSTKIIKKFWRHDASDAPTEIADCIVIGDFIMAVGEHKLSANKAARTLSRETESVTEPVRFCEYCFARSPTKEGMRLHYQLEHPSEDQCKPPGTVVAQMCDSTLYEVAGWEAPTYCFRLCTVAQHFIRYKTVFKNPNNVRGFRFYVVVNAEWAVMGYYSSSLSRPAENVACICVFPPFQRRGLARFLIDHSYKASREALLANQGPERPISDAALIAYSSYWRRRLATAIIAILTMPGADEANILSPTFLAELTGIRIQDVMTALLQLDLITVKQVTGATDGVLGWKYSREEMLDRANQFVESKKRDLEPESPNGAKRQCTDSSSDSTLPGSQTATMSNGKVQEEGD
eukprot:TRINITY_DN1701_c0_g1_i1.p1 TRINITY_DN1701_c0_g1~~TRINITY_DN1701_c0_g1_i1.p1  ORF type:complete len:351 (+),score=2.15 TRINITY_DN1701_c0_g1_i1:87-1139(+)